MLFLMGGLTSGSTGLATQRVCYHPACGLAGYPRRYGSALVSSMKLAASALLNEARLDKVSS